MLKRTGFVALLLIVAAGIFAACGDDKGEPDNREVPNVSNDPVTLTMFLAAGSANQIRANVVEPMQAELPHISIELIEPGEGVNLESLVMSGNTPDLIHINNAMAALHRMEMIYDHRELIQKHNFDLGRFQPQVLEQIQGADGEILQFPLAVGGFSLFYNRRLFDQFAVPYPEDNMTWDDIYDLARHMTREVDGKQYFGFGAPMPSLIASNQLSAAFYNEATMAADLESDGWKTIFQGYARLFQFPGTADYLNPLTGGQVNGLFINEQVVAMRAGANFFGQLEPVPELDWDFVTMPTFPSRPEVKMQFNANVFTIAPTSAYKDQAFQAIAFWMSDEYQTERSRLGAITVLQNPDVQAAFGTASRELFEGRNVESLFKHNFADTRFETPYDAIARDALFDALKQVITGTTDVNSALRAANERTNREVESLRQQ